MSDGLIMQETTRAPLIAPRDADHDLRRTPTSVVIEELLASAPAGYITLEWLFASLRERSFGLVMLFLGLMAILPGICALAGIALIALSIQMLMGRTIPILPRFMACRPMGRPMLLVKYTIPLIRFLERFVSPRWAVPLQVTQWGVGLGLLLMAATLLMPIPFSNVVPGIIIIFAALAYLEGDGLLLTFALVASLAAFLGMLAAIWGATRGAIFLLHV